MTGKMKATIAVELCGAWADSLYKHTGRKRLKNLSDKFFIIADDLKAELLSDQKKRISKLLVNRLSNLREPTISEAAVLIASFAGTASKFLDNSKNKRDWQYSKRIEELATSKTVQNIITDEVNMTETYKLSDIWHNAFRLY